MVATVSVIVPFYGTTHSQRLELVAESILSQRGINVDFIVAGLNYATKVSTIRDLENHPKEESLDIARMGKIINNGIRLMKGDFTYISDADILLNNKEYLENLVQESLSSGNSLKRSPMRRLLLQDFKWFYQNVSLKGLELAIQALDLSQDYVVKPSQSNRPMKVFPKFENKRQKIFIASKSDFKDYLSNEENKCLEPIYFNQDRHCGAVFALTEELIKIGGYHEGFISWGVWDADVQWKLENQTGMRLIPSEKQFEVIHLDHPRGYFSKSKWEQDKELQKRRRAMGPKECIERDRKDYFGQEVLIYGKRR
jgi:hypothetical protein